ncbi:AAA family ATPase [Sedimenticola thiotaurini]|uniref:DNA 3'-5' helicase II n=1 Tax=Sedimenticola thiotaurini TaxID=1543721 RepID=A0A0F7K2R5_9GAMM|nr:AAA family ATPase [Sedimenticola thiotaurini]AKH21864.1 helicase UvrD [Sedimenticola thiotaurini]
MDKRVVFAVAGSGKTSSIIDRVEEDSRCLIVTYTDNNTKHLRNRIIQKLGKIPAGVRIYSYFTFLYSFCYRPLYGYEVKTKGINFNYPLPINSQRSAKNTRIHYFDKNDRLFASRIAKLLIEFDVVPEVIERIETFFDLVCIDEVQDFAANDFNFICALANVNVEMLLVGDFYQHTFDTSRDGNTQKNLHSCFGKYCKKISNAGFAIDLESLSHSYRCSPSVCSFVENELAIEIQSHRKDQVEVRLVDNSQEVEDIYFNDSIVKLFYQKSNSYYGYNENWGNTKGLDHFQDVCVVLNPTTFKAFESGQLAQLPPTTRNKLYVACTRAKGNLYFVSEKILKKYRI